MVGTVFTNLMANALVTTHTGISQFLYVRGRAFETKSGLVNSVQAEQTRTVYYGGVPTGHRVLVVQIAHREFRMFLDDKSKAGALLMEEWGVVPYNERMRWAFIRLLRDCEREKSRAQYSIRRDLGFFSGVYREEISSPHPNKGQVLKAYTEGRDSWGESYIPMLMMANMAQVRNNFKDLTVQGFGGPLFRGIQRGFDRHFETLAAPEPSRRGHDVQLVQTFSTYNDADGGCVDGEGTMAVALCPGERLSPRSSSATIVKGVTYQDKKVREIKPGDRVLTGQGEESAVVRCVVTMPVNSPVMCCVGGVRVW